MATLQEVTFIEDSYGTSHNISGLPALAKRVQTLLISEPGSIPNCPRAGAGVGLFLHEHADSITLEQIDFLVSGQLKTYLPEYSFSTIESRFIKDPNNNNVLAIFFKLSSNEDIDQNSFALVFSRETSGNNKILSDFISNVKR